MSGLPGPTGATGQRPAAAPATEVATGRERETALVEQYYLATQWQLMWRNFRRHRLALVGGAVLAVFYVTALLAEFVAPTVPAVRDRDLGLRAAPSGAAVS